MHLDRAYPASFRSLPMRNAPEALLSSIAPLVVRCQCQKITFTVSVPSNMVPERCHCVQCRKFSASAFAVHIPLESTPEVLLVQAGSGGPQSYESACDGRGGATLSRLFCSRCRSVLGAQMAGSAGSSFLLALGCVEDDSVPPALALHWQVNFRALAPEQAPAWWSARPAGCRPMAPARVLRGSCACGACSFEAASGDEFQVYCTDAQI